MNDKVDKDVKLTANNEGNVGFVRTNVTEVSVNESVKVETDFDFSGIQPMIRNSPHFLVYFDWMRADWSVRVCEAQAKAKFGEAIGYQTFALSKKFMKDKGYIIPNYKATLLGNIEVEFLDAIQETKNKIMLRFRRIAEIARKEENWQKKVGDVPYISQALQAEQDGLSKDLALLFEMEQKVREGKVRMGIYEGEEVIDIETSKDLTENDVKKEIQKLTKEQADKLRMAIFYLDGMDYLDTLLGFDVVATEEYVEVCIAHLLFADDFSKVTEHIAMKWSEFPLFRARDVKIEEYVRMERV